MKTPLLKSFCIGVAVLSASPAFAFTPVTSPIAPGDIIFTEFFNGWHKLDPVSGVVTPLPWPDDSFTDFIRFDVDGAILFDSFNNQVKRLNPISGVTRDHRLPAVPLQGFEVEPNGDLLFATSSGVFRFAKADDSVTPLAQDTFFSPRGMARGADGRVFITEFFNDLWEIDAAAASRTHVAASTDLVLPDLIAVQPDGDLLVENFAPDALYEIDPDTGLTSLFTDDLPTFVSDFAFDALGNLWLTSTDGIFRYGAGGGSKTLIADDTFFNPRAIAIVPPNWTAPPVPEPSTLLLAIGATIVATGHIRRLSIQKS